MPIRAITVITCSVGCADAALCTVRSNAASVDDGSSTGYRPAATVPISRAIVVAEARKADR